MTGRPVRTCPIHPSPPTADSGLRHRVSTRVSTRDSRLATRVARHPARRWASSLGFGCKTSPWACVSRRWNPTVRWPARSGAITGGGQSVSKHVSRPFGAGLDLPGNRKREEVKGRRAIL